MDPASAAIGAVSGAIALADVAFKIVQTVSGVIKRFQNAPLVLHSIVTTCKAIQVAWDRIHNWATSELANRDQGDPIFDDLIMFVEAGRVLLEALREELDLEEFSFQPKPNWTRMERYHVVSKEQALKDCCGQLAAQVASLNLLLSAARLPYTETRESVIKLLKPVFRKDEESAWTIVNSKAASSRASKYWSTIFDNTDEKGPMQDRQFAFDYYLFTAPVYRRLFFPQARNDQADTGMSIVTGTDVRANPESIAEAQSIFSSSGWDRSSIYSTATVTNAEEMEVQPLDSELIQLIKISNGVRYDLERLVVLSETTQGERKSDLSGRTEAESSAATETPNSVLSLEPPDDSSEEGEDTPCHGCKEILKEGKAYELAGRRWHIDCFRCSACSTPLDSDANLLLLGDGSLICNNCTYACSACGNKIEELAILTGDQAFCEGCFKCRNCRRKIENLRYARTSQGIFCMPCHEALMARRRKKARDKRPDYSGRSPNFSKPLPNRPRPTS